MDHVPHIAVVDDHREIRELIGQYLKKQGYRVSTAEGGTALRRLLDTGAPDLVVLDIMMPGEDGLTLCRTIRSRPGPSIPIIFLTARTEETDRVIGLELGADDYIVKPFSSRELVARIKAVLRRSNSLPPQRVVRRASAIRFDRWVLDFGRRELQGDDGIGVPLSTAEFRLLNVFVERPGIVLSRDQLLDLTVGREAEPFDRSIDNQVSRLRRKVERDPKNPVIIQTHRGGGYSFMPEVYTT
ncbi:response regulator transcription factor [Palleronia sp. LCG004]|uniref:response regulator transcription factor n=1 Tax=Palleronia sp. LCG004 TaxID=3079304 RepID=UPI002943C291|nr:response regulator transcription factor [Palleronia sp. LCG004]WOI57880.1 response regulator transcription factor [Palleronia sp. LCG004]